MEYKLIAFDMDGTLLSSDKKLSNTVIQAVKEASNNSKTVIISTGRCLPELDEIFKHTPSIRYAIVCNGALIYDIHNKSIIYSNTMDSSTVEQILKIGFKRDIMMHILDFKCVVEKEKVKNIDKYHMQPYKPMYDLIGLQVDNIYSYFQENREPLQKINIYHPTVDDKKQTLEKLANLNITLKHGEGTIIECTSPNVNKGIAFKKLCNYLNIELKNTIAVGDSFNDIEMLKNAGLAIAVENAEESVKNICDVIVSDNDHDGCAQAIYNYLLKQ